MCPVMNSWVKLLSVNHTNNFNFADDNDRACNNEDINRNGIIEAGEDINNNSELDPENPAAVPDRVTTDASGFGLFNVTYAKEFTWVIVELEARTVVAGSEAFSKATFTLTGLATDFTNCEVSPPGHFSPYGQARSCICDELHQPGQCPTLTTASINQSFLMTVSILELPVGGTNNLDDALFNNNSNELFNNLGIKNVMIQVDGGTKFRYNISASDGNIVNEFNETISVIDFGQRFYLTTNGDQDNEFITITVTDQDTGLTRTRTIFQNVN